MRASAFAGFFGLFAGLCAIFAGCVTLADWYSEIAQARKPVVSALPDHLHNDLVLLAIAVMACVVSLELAKRLKAREAVHPASDGDGTQHRVLGVVVAAMGLFPTGLIIYRAVPPGALKLDDLAGLCVSLMFVFAGILLGLPPEYTRWRSFLATLLMTCFALAFDWVAFAPGERKFSGSFLGVGFIPSAVFGRALFGVFAVTLDICAVAMWIRLVTGRTEDRLARGV
jgi:hypothetical protein